MGLVRTQHVYLAPISICTLLLIFECLGIRVCILVHICACLDMYLHTMAWANSAYYCIRYYVTQCCVKRNFRVVNCLMITVVILLHMYFTAFKPDFRAFHRINSHRKVAKTCLLSCISMHAWMVCTYIWYITYTRITTHAPTLSLQYINLAYIFSLAELPGLLSDMKTQSFSLLWLVAVCAVWTVLCEPEFNRGADGNSGEELNQNDPQETAEPLEHGDVNGELSSLVEASVAEEDSNGAQTGQIASEDEIETERRFSRKFNC